MKLLLSTTWKYIRRNPGLSLATIVIITITFAMGTLLFIMNLFASATVNYLQSQPTISVLYNPKEKEENIAKFKSYLESQPGVVAVVYNNSSEIQREYLNSIGIPPEQQNQYAFDGNQMHVLRLQLEPNQDYQKFIALINEEKNKGALIVDIIFVQQIVDRIREFSNTVRIGGGIITLFLIVISLVLIYLTIGFTINRFAQEIDIMQLVGADSKLIMMPFILQGAFYGAIAAIFSYTTMLIFWGAAVMSLQNNILFEFIRNIITEVGLGALFTFTPLYLVFGIILTVIGIFIGVVCSYFATKRYIKI
jgi:cell division protein FtsX